MTNNSFESETSIQSSNSSREIIASTKNSTTGRKKILTQKISKKFQQLLNHEQKAMDDLFYLSEFQDINRQQNNYENIFDSLKDIDQDPQSPRMTPKFLQISKQHQTKKRCSHSLGSDPKFSKILQDKYSSIYKLDKTFQTEEAFKSESLRIKKNKIYRKDSKKDDSFLLQNSKSVLMDKNQQNQLNQVHSKNQLQEKKVLSENKRNQIFCVSFQRLNVKKCSSLNKNKEVLLKQIKSYIDKVSQQNQKSSFLEKIKRTDRIVKLNQLNLVPKLPLSRLSSTSQEKKTTQLNKKPQDSQLENLMRLNVTTHQFYSRNLICKRQRN